MLPTGTRVRRKVECHPNGTDTVKEGALGTIRSVDKTVYGIKLDDGFWVGCNETNFDDLYETLAPPPKPEPLPSCLSQWCRLTAPYMNKGAL